MKKVVSKADVANKKALPAIVAIIKIEKQRITVLWNTSETKVIEFEPIFEYWKTTKNYHLFKKLENFNEFSKVKLIDDTLTWKNIEIAGGYLSLDPESLYQNSKPINDYILLSKKESQLAGFDMDKLTD